jgi:manganese transport protein
LTSTPDRPALAVRSTPSAPPGAPRETQPRARVLRVARLCGPAVVVSVAYVDPGNFATNFSAGARYGFLLVWVIAAANLVAMFVQALSAKLGIATGESLPALCRGHLPRPLTRLLWFQGELIAICTDVAEFIGGAIGLNLLFGIPLLPGAVLTAVASTALLSLAPHGRRRFEIAMACLLTVILAGFAYQALAAGNLGGTVQGLIPHLAGEGSLVLAAGIVGATVMPHVIYLHSALTRHQGKQAGGQAAMRASRVDIALVLGVAGAVNIAMLAVAASAVHGTGTAGSLPAIHSRLGTALGHTAAATFAFGLVASGLASSSVGTYAGQVIMDGFLRRRVPLLARRLVSVIPALGILAAGANPTSALILSQVVLSAGLPFALVPLTFLTSKRKLMGDLVNRWYTTTAAIVITVAVIVINTAILVSATAH